MKYLSFICLYLVGFLAHSENQYSERVCLESHCYINEAVGSVKPELKEYYFKLVETISVDPSGMVYFTDEVKEHSRGNPLDRFVHHFKWVKRESLIDIVIGKEYSAILLKKSEGDRRVLYYSHDLKKYEIGYESPEQYKPIDKYWVNGTSDLKIN